SARLALDVTADAHLPAHESHQRQQPTPVPARRVRVAHSTAQAWLRSVAKPSAPRVAPKDRSHPAKADPDRRPAAAFAADAAPPAQAPARPVPASARTPDGSDSDRPRTAQPWREKNG